MHRKFKVFSYNVFIIYHSLFTSVLAAGTELVFYTFFHTMALEISVQREETETRCAMG